MEVILKFHIYIEFMHASRDRITLILVTLFRL